MASSNFELEAVDRLLAAAVGEPGRRHFFLLASQGHQTVTLSCEKFHIQGLLTRARQLLEAQEIESSSQVLAAGPSPTPAVGQPDWAIGELGLGYHESKRKFVIVARELRVVEDQPDPEPGLFGAGGEAADDQRLGSGPAPEGDAATARLWVTPEQVREFAEQADKVLAGGRPTCNYCGLPIDPAGHPCPAANGSRPIF